MTTAPGSSPSTVNVICPSTHDTPVPGGPSTLDVCGECGSEIWVANTSRDAINRLGPTMTPLLLCLTCGVPRMTHASAFLTTNAQLREVAESTGAPGASARFAERFGVPLVNLDEGN
jgi:hypothetical protein